MTVYHGGRFGYDNGTLEYIWGEMTVIEDVDMDCWSLFEAYAEVGQFGYTNEKIVAFWYKDSSSDWLENDLKLFEGDRDAIEMSKITGKRGHVDLYVVHKVEVDEEFPEVGFLDVGGPGEQVQEAERANDEEEVDRANAETVKEGDKLNPDEQVKSNSDEDSDDEDFIPSDGEVDSADDVMFTDSEEEYDDESRFDEVRGGTDGDRIEKGKGVAGSDFSDEEGFNSDEVDVDYEVGGGSEKEDSEDDDNNEAIRYPIHKDVKDMTRYKWEVGTVFASREEFKDTVTAYAVQKRRGLRYAKLDLVRVRAVCQEGCPFWLYAAKMSEEETWQLRSMNLKHTCGQSHRVEILHTGWLSKAFRKKVEGNPKVKIKDLVNKAQRKWNLIVTTSMAARLDKLHWMRFRELTGSSTKGLLTTARNCYVLIQAACKKSFLQCRKFVGLDGCFLKTPQGGQLLTAIGWDPNDQMLPIAYAIVEALTKDTWKWFFWLLIDDIGAEVIGKSTFMSDQQKGLLPAFDEVIPGVDHRFCVRHLYSNFRKKFPGLHLKQLMWRCAKATHWKEWEKEMQIIRQINVDAHRHLNAILPRFWSRSRFNFHSKCDTLVKNMCESFNGAIVDSREKPIVTMLEDIRVYLMSRWALNRERIKNFNGTVLPRTRMKLERRGRLAGEWRPYWSAAQTYKVVNGLSKFSVDLSAHECSYRKWQLSGIPCTHAISCINYKGLDIDGFVDDYYKKAAYVKCYDSVINPLNGPDLWEKTNFDDVMPPPYRKPSHRPVKKRKR
ncbi:uncharacterized protein LOC107647087 [Arachis ipaensis]|uniref:uncharacterized protein LOC107647087 n=1 Tax=Arachis ipaensis TaxID=130454 RepID=UPI0007AF895E|nr:uncharacterized protein LOC107647087 [Arachis ipaensis]